jgi:hypothetical protein
MNVVIQTFLYKASQGASQQEILLKQQRQHEIDICFQVNCHHPAVKKMYVLCETHDALIYYQELSREVEEKMYFVMYGHQPTYKEFLEFIHETIPNNEIVCIMNSDIYFHTSFQASFVEKHLQEKMIFGLTRHEHSDLSHTTCNEETCPLVYLHRGSHDTFLFRTPIPSEIDLSTINNKQNLFGSENIFLHAWNKAKCKVLNPCHELITIHLHRGRVYFQDYKRINVGREYFCDKEECPEDSNTLIKLPDRLENKG